MTGVELQVEFETAASFIDEIKDIRIISTDVNYYLREAEHVFINKRLKNIFKKVEGSQKDMDELRSISIKDTALALDGVNSTATKLVYDLPSDYKYLLNDRSITSFCSVSNEYQNRLSPLENVHKLLKYKYTSTRYDDPVSALSGNKLYIYIDSSFTISAVNIDYIRSTTDIDVINNVTSELDSNVHKDIVQLAVNIFLENVQSGRFVSNTEKNRITEQIN